MSTNRDEITFPKKKRLWSSEFKFRANRYWKKSSLPGTYKRDWVPETPPKQPTDNPWVDNLQKQPNAPESTQTCHPSKWKYGSQYRNGAYYSHGRPFVDKDGWFCICGRFYECFAPNCRNHFCSIIQSLDFETIQVLYNI